MRSVHHCLIHNTLLTPPEIQDRAGYSRTHHGPQLTSRTDSGRARNGACIDRRELVF